jgi:periplasmic protein TonB
MYEAMSQRAPNSTQIAGAATTVLVTALVGYGLANGIGARFVEALMPETTITIVPPTEEKRDPVERTKLDTTATLTMPEPGWRPDEFVPDDGGIIVKEGPKLIIDTGPLVIGPVTKASRIAPKLRPADKPYYPAASIRAQEQGTTGLQVCVDARGRVSSASVAQSSGYQRLDEAALKWVRDARFTPGSVDGAAQAVCGHPVFYEWKLENARN